LASSGELNGAVTQTLNVMLIYCLVAYGGALLWVSVRGRLWTEPLLAAGGGFWLLRANLQPMLFETRSKVAVAITIIFMIGAALHLIAAVQRTLAV
jgi:hypothetical protein